MAQIFIMNFSARISALAFVGTKCTFSKNGRGDHEAENK